jgi:threonine/homoserine/homoserine lactone efflux protein
VPSANLLAFAATSAVIVAIPGPSLLFTIGRALTAGRRAALLTVLGNGVGLFVQVLLVAVGLGALVATSAAVYAVVKYAGAAYLIWLGIDAIRHRADLHEAVTEGAAPTAAHRGALRTGLIVGISNPKTIVFFAALLPQFVDRSASLPQPVQMVVLGAVFFVLAIVGDSIWALAASSARDWFAQSPRRLSRLRGAGGVMICGLGAGVALTRSAP